MKIDWTKVPGFAFVANRAVIAALGALSGIGFAAFPLQMAALCSGN